MVIHAITSFGITKNFPLLRLLPYQDLTREQLGFFLSQRRKLREGIGKDTIESVEILDQYDVIFRKILMTHSYHIIKPFIEDMPPEFLKTIYLKKWRQTIRRDLFKVYSSYPPHQILPQIHQFIAKYKHQTIKKSHLTELRIWSEVFYVNFTKVKNEGQKKIFFENTENYFRGLIQTPMVDTMRKRVNLKKIYSNPNSSYPPYPLEACYYLLNAGWWLMDHLIKNILAFFTLDCDLIIYDEAVSCLLEFDSNELLTASYELLISRKITDKALPYFLKLFYLPGELEENNFYARSEEFLLKALAEEKHYSRRVQICLALSNLFSPEFLTQGSALFKKSHFNFSMYKKYRALLQERLLVHSLITGENVEGLEDFLNNYVERESDSGNSSLNRLNTSFFFKKRNKKD